VNENVKHAIANYVIGRSDFRSEKSEQYPDDTRNHRSASALRGLAEHILSLPDDDDRLVAIAKVDDYMVSKTDNWSPRRAVAYVVDRYGFDDPEDDHDAAFTEIAFAEFADTDELEE